MNLQLFWPLRNNLPLNVKNRGAELFNSIIQNFLKRKTIHYYSRFTDKRPSIAERVIRLGYTGVGYRDSKRKNFF